MMSSLMNLKLQLFKKKKEYVLMHRNTPVLLFTYDETEHRVISIEETYNVTHLPLGIQKGGRVNLPAFEKWMKSRCIPEDRCEKNVLLENLGVSDVYDLMFKGYGVCVSDGYCYMEKGQQTNYKAISPYRHDYDYEGFYQAAFNHEHVPPSASCTPSNTLNGTAVKAWRKDGNGTLYLDRKSMDSYGLEAVSHRLASIIADMLDLHACRYDIRTVSSIIVSTCTSFCNEDTEMISAEQILSSFSTKAYELASDTYIRILKDHGIKDVEKKISDMFLLDYLLLKEDRSLTDFGVLSDSRTGRWTDIVPAFSFGNTLACFKEEDELDAYEQNANCMMFNASSVSYESLYPYILFDEYDFTPLKKLPQIYGNLLVEYQNITGISNDRIEKQYILLYKRIRSLLRAQKAFHHTR